MGVEYYLVDDEGKNVLDVHKWYALNPEDWSNVTVTDIRAASPCDKLGGEVDWLVEAALSWTREVAGGRRVRLVTGCSDQEEVSWNDWRTGKAVPGWTHWSAFYSSLALGRGVNPWPPSGRDAWCAEDARRVQLAPVLLPLPGGASGWFDAGEP
jgi:hypothetical protein